MGININTKFKTRGGVIGVSASSKMEKIVAGSIDKNIYLLDKNLKRLWKKELDFPIWSVDIDEKGGKIVAGTAFKSPANGSIYMLNKDGKIDWKFQVDAPIWSVSLDQVEKNVLAGSWNNYLYLLDKDGQLLWKKKIGEMGVYGSKISKDGKIIAAVTFDSTLSILGRNGEILNTIELNSGCYGIDIGENDDYIAVACENGMLRMFTITGKDDWSVDLDNQEICGVAMIGNTDFIFASSFSGLVFLIQKYKGVLDVFNIGDQNWAVWAEDEGRDFLVGSSDGLIYNLRIENYSDYFGESRTSEYKIKRKEEYTKDVFTSEAEISKRLMKLIEMEINSISARSNKILVIMPFDKSFNDIYQLGIKQAVEECGYICVRADEIFHTKSIIDVIFENIYTSKFIIADLTNQSPNVFYELGIAHGWGKKVILLTQKRQDVPFDLQQYLNIEYDSIIGLKRALKLFIENMGDDN